MKHVFTPHHVLGVRELTVHIHSFGLRYYKLLFFIPRPPDNSLPYGDFSQFISKWSPSNLRSRPPRCFKKLRARFFQRRAEYVLWTPRLEENQLRHHPLDSGPELRIRRINGNQINYSTRVLSTHIYCTPSTRYTVLNFR